MNSGIYVGHVRHRRRGPTAHAFTFPLFMMYLDLDELDEVFERRWLWSTKRPAPAWLRRQDYLGPSDVELPEAVRRAAERLTHRRPAGPIRMLTHLRYLGFAMNPVTFYYCFTENGARVDTILAEITNTPWRERHTYALGPADAGACARPHRFRKAFHISPFMGMEQEYDWRFSEPGRAISVRMSTYQGSERIFDAALRLRRREISGRTLAGALTRYPWMTARVSAGIYWQALRLRLKGNPYHEHPDRRAT